MRLISTVAKLFTLGAILLGCAIPALGADAKLVEAARKEGKLVVYTSMLTENATALLAKLG